MKQDIQNLFSVNEVELVYKNKTPFSDRKRISSAASAYDLLMAAWDMNKIELQEQSYALLLDRSSAVLGLSHMGTGGISGCVVDPKLLFALALKCKASSIILAHNHPSGNLQPSNSDMEMTKRLVAAGDFLDIKLLDHLIVTPTSYYSFAQEGLIP